jgi:hypothetical protein
MYLVSSIKRLKKIKSKMKISDGYVQGIGFVNKQPDITWKKAMDGELYPKIKRTVWNRNVPCILRAAALLIEHGLESYSCLAIKTAVAQAYGIDPGSVYHTSYNPHTEAIALVDKSIDFLAEWFKPEGINKKSTWFNFSQEEWTNSPAEVLEKLRGEWRATTLCLAANMYEDLNQN